MDLEVEEVDLKERSELKEFWKTNANVVAHIELDNSEGLFGGDKYRVRFSTPSGYEFFLGKQKRYDRGQRLKLFKTINSAVSDLRKAGVTGEVIVKL